MKAWRSPLAWGALVMGSIIAVAVLAPLISPYDPRALTGESFEGPSSRHLLGTNNIGQDVFSQVLWGARESLIVSVGGSALAIGLGSLIGIGAGLLGGAVDVVVMRVVDAFLALPGLPLIVLIAATVGPSRVAIIAVIGVAGWPGLARILRSQTLSLRQRGYIAAARGFAAGPLYVMRRHLAPALGPLLVTSLITWSAAAIFLQSALAFLGLGDPTGVSWGLMLNRAIGLPGLFLTPAWTWLILPAGTAITLVILGFTLLGIGLERRFNPRARLVL